MTLPSAVPHYIIESLVRLASKAPEGNIVEVGVYQGGTAWHLTELAKQQNRKIYLYDTFSGIPFKGDLDYHQVGDFSDTSFEKVRDALPYATVVEGIFPDSAVEMDNIAFVHLDCDQYQSVIDSIAYLKPKMVKGGIIWFDDAIGDHNYVGTPGQVNGADFAMRELYGKDFLISDCGKPYVIV
jgi:predicted O-methyltransferase YrrM